MRSYDILLDRVASFRLVVDAVRAGESDLLFVSDDSSAVHLLWGGLRRTTAEMPVACAFVDFGRTALSPALFLRGVDFAVASALGGDKMDVDGPPRWLISPTGPIHTDLADVLDRFVAEASDRDLRPVLAVKELTSLRALKSYKGVDDAFSILGKALAKLPELRLVVLEYGLSPDAVFEIAAKCLRRTAVKHLVMPRLSDEEVFQIASGVLDRRLSDEEAGTLRSLCDGRLSYLLSFRDLLAAMGAQAAKRELVSFVADAVVDPLSELSRLMRSRMADAISSVRGDTVLRHILRVLSFAAEGMTSSEVAAQIGRSVPATYDYLKWLMRSLLLTRQGARYFFSDRLLKLWIKLDTLSVGTTSGALGDLARGEVSNLLSEALPDEAPEAEAASELPAAALEEQETEAEYRIEVSRPRDDDILEYD